MKVIIDGAINVYYVQTLCMIYFPGTKFSEDEVVTPETPILRLKLWEDDAGTTADASLQIGDRTVTATHTTRRSPRHTAERRRKLAVGAAVTTVCSDMLDYRPSWGMLTGVRPSKVATQLLLSGVERGEVERQLSAEYFVIPKKAALATEVACNEQKIIGSPDRRDCSVYIAIPFCPTRCAYCSFVSYTSKRLLSLIPEYLIKLAGEIHRMFETIRELGLRVRTVYIGGGTPTILDASQLRFLLEQVAREIDVSTLLEYTLESGRPDTIDAEKLQVARQLGVNRISVNPQSLCDEVLQGIGRSHTVEDFFRAYEIARASGIPVINTDLIVGLPGDTFPTFSYTYDKILELAPENVTVHTFCVKKSAEILHTMENVYSIHGGDAGKCVDYSQIRAEQTGYIPYYMYRQKNTVGNFENVGFAKPGTEGLYNIYMMEEVHTIFAAGAGAVTKLVEYDTENWKRTRIKRLFSHKYPYEYLASDNFDEIAEQSRAFFEDVPLD